MEKWGEPVVHPPGRTGGLEVSALVQAGAKLNLVLRAGNMIFEHPAINVKVRFSNL